MLATSSAEESDAKKQTKKSTGKKQSNNARKQSETQAKKSIEQECLFCQEQNISDVFDKFMKKPMDDRKEFAKRKGLCYACLKPNHISRMRRARATCRTCSKRHPTALHFDKKDDNVKKEDSTDEDTSALKSVIAHAQTITMFPLVIQRLCFCLFTCLLGKTQPTSGLSTPY